MKIAVVSIVAILADRVLKTISVGRADLVFELRQANELARDISFQ